MLSNLPAIGRSWPAEPESRRCAGLPTHTASPAPVSHSQAGTDCTRSLCLPTRQADRLLYATGTMPARLTLAGLFEAAGDPVQLILAQTSPKTLAALAASCRSLHAVIARQPESVWKAAARAAYPPSHPARRAADVRAQLQLLHAVAANIDSGNCSRADLRTKAGCPSSDLKWQAALDKKGAEVVVWELRTQVVHHRWPLPSSSAVEWHSRLWDTTSQYLACCGRTGPGGLNAVAFLQVRTGACTRVALPADAIISKIEWSAPSDRPSTFLVRNGAVSYSVYSAGGFVIDSIPVPDGGSASSHKWSPCSELLACSPLGATQSLCPLLWIWRIGSGGAASAAAEPTPLGSIPERLVSRLCSPPAWRAAVLSRFSAGLPPDSPGHPMHFAHASNAPLHLALLRRGHRLALQSSAAGCQQLPVAGHSRSNQSAHPCARPQSHASSAGLPAPVQVLCNVRLTRRQAFHRPARHSYVQRHLRFKLASSA